MSGPNSTSPNVTPAMLALPADTGSGNGSNTINDNGPAIPSDGNTSRKFYTITAELRETYDDNVNTTKDDKVTAVESSLSPSILVDFPSPGNDFTGRYTLGVNYYSALNGGSINGGSLQITHEAVAQYQHTFSDLYVLNASELFRYYNEPSVYQSTGTFFRDGSYVTNVINGVFSAQFTPLLSTTTTYANTIVRYDEEDIAEQQDNIENTGSESVNFAILPKVTLSLGVIVDNLDYRESIRGYTNYTLFTGVQWAVLPTLSVIVRGGGSYTEAEDQPASATPYVDAELNWTLGKKSSLNFTYSHEVVPSDEFGADGEVADRFSGSFNYDATSRITTYLQAIYTYADVTPTLIIGGLLPAYTESDYALNLGATYHYDNYIDFEGGYQISGVSSGLSDRDYNRNQVYLGIRGTY